MRSYGSQSPNFDDATPQRKRRRSDCPYEQPEDVHPVRSPTAGGAAVRSIAAWSPIDTVAAAIPPASAPAPESISLSEDAASKSGPTITHASSPLRTTQAKEYRV